MSFIRSLMRRRQFILVFLGSIVTSVISLVCWRVSDLFAGISRAGTARASEKPAAGGKKSPRGIVAYYSATGNTAQVADAIWRGMNSVMPCDAAPMKKLKPRDMAKYDVVAIGSPNWYMRVPANVLVFIHAMPRMDGKHCILFGTHGSGGPGMFWIMSRNILKRGLRIIGWSDWYGSDILTPHNCIPDAEWGHPDVIDLAEAEAFGRRMALNSVKIYGGESGLLPERIPTPEIGGSSLFSPSGMGNKIGFAGGAANGSPKFDFTKCVYPRCNQCIANCPVNAIDFSVVAPAGVLEPKSLHEHPVVLKEACLQCGGLCERVCHYNAIAYIGDRGKRVFQKIDMKTCIYPKCTACMDRCPQDAIDVTKNPPVVYNFCENESLCFGVCPVNAIDFTPTSMHIDEGNAAEGRTVRPGPMPVGTGAPGQMPGAPGGPGGPGGAGSPVKMGGAIAGDTLRFRSLVEDKCSKGRVVDFKVYPRVPIDKKLWPYHMDKTQTT